jgi:methylmalonyl-CoA carboxyltransferase large subunit
MPTVTENDLAATLEELHAQMAEISRRIHMLEKGAGSAPAPPVPAAVAAPASAPAAITEEELLAISAAIGAYLGVRAHIRQIRLVSTSAWAQQGRVSIQASHGCKAK